MFGRNVFDLFHLLKSTTQESLFIGICFTNKNIRKGVKQFRFTSATLTEEKKKERETRGLCIDYCIFFLFIHI